MSSEHWPAVQLFCKHMLFLDTARWRQVRRPHLGYNDIMTALITVIASTIYYKGAALLTYFLFTVQQNLQVRD